MWKLLYYALFGIAFLLSAQADVLPKRWMTDPVSGRNRLMNLQELREAGLIKRRGRWVQKTKPQQPVTAETALRPAANEPPAAAHELPPPACRVLDHAHN